MSLPFREGGIRVSLPFRESKVECHSPPLLVKPWSSPGGGPPHPKENSAPTGDPPPPKENSPPTGDPPHPKENPPPTGDPPPPVRAWTTTNGGPLPPGGCTDYPLWLWRSLICGYIYTGKPNNNTGRPNKNMYSYSYMWPYKTIAKYIQVDRIIIKLTL